jgi:putative FmdB family regulatory protein
MPIYSYLCKDCKEESEEYRQVRDRLRAANCKDCGGRAEFVLSAKAKSRELYPFVDEYMDSRPVKIRSLKHYRQELSKRGKQESGRRPGMKGQWV